MKVFIKEIDGRVLTVGYKGNTLVKSGLFLSGDTYIHNVYCGRVDKIVSSLQAAFVEIAPDMYVFLPVQRNHELHEGKKVLIMINKDAVGDKVPKATMDVELTEENLVWKPKSVHKVAFSRKISNEVREGMQPIANILHNEGGEWLLRTSSSEASLEQLKEEAERLKERWQRIEQSFHTNKDVRILYEAANFLNWFKKKFKKEEVEEIIIRTGETGRTLQKEYGTNKMKLLLPHEEEPLSWSNAVNELIAEKVWLSNGSYIVIEETEAFTSMDVNSSKAISSKNYVRTVKETNELALKEVAQQILLRNISGMILIDLISTEIEEEKKEYIKILHTALASDSVPYRIHGITKLGILEMTRMRKEASMQQLLTSVCPSCHGRGFQVQTYFR